MAAGVWFRAQDERNNYLWQLRSGHPAVLKTHVQRNGAYAVLAEKTLDIAISAGESFDWSIRLQDDRFETRVNGRLVDVTRDDTFTHGTIGLRNGRTEAQRWHRIRFSKTDGSAVIDEDFAAGPGLFTGQQTDRGDLVLGRSETTLAALGLTNDWLLARTEFEVSGEVDAAWVRATGRSPEPARQYVYRLAVNGDFAGIGPVRAFDPDTQTRYHVHDITDRLTAGRNAVSAICYSAERRAFMADIVITYSDGRRQVIGTGTDWRVRSGDRLRPPAGFTGGGYYQAPQEYIHAGAEPAGWQHPGFDDASWPAPVAGAELPGLAPGWVDNVACWTVEADSSVQLGQGHWLVDLGQEIVGGLQLDITGRAGQTVEVRLGEERDGNGARYHLRASQTFREVWTLRDGQQRLQHWGYRAFRWIELLTDPNLDVLSGLTARALKMPWRDDDADFASSNDDLDRVWDFCRYSIDALRLDVYQDTPTRERLPYEGDAIINQLSEYNTQRSYSLARYSIAYLARRPTWPTEYRLMPPILAWRDYMATGDDSRFAEDYPLYVESQLTEYLNSDGLVEKDPGQSSQVNGDLVDWPAANRDGYVFTRVNTVINAWQYAAFRALSQIADVLGRANERQYYAALADRLRSAMNAQLVAANGAYVDGLGTSHQAQHASAFALALGVADERICETAGAWLAGQSMRVSVYAPQQLLDGLYVSGHAQSALRLMTSRATFSWLHMMDDLQATITMEAWDPSIKGNTTFSHAWGTAPANVVMRFIAGVGPIAPGAQRLRIAPQPADLGWFKARVPTARGPVAVAFQRGERQMLAITLPPNVESEVVLDLTQFGDIDPARVRAVARGYQPQLSHEGQTLTIRDVRAGQLVVLDDSVG
ncbi:family 78 glycoside hydrolase catalytic domain [Salinisphaera sp. SPP-AMP-43]|uniref:family 78 glycoside hydrolase catalytic domain n=1 Tax=Salinisphaera sp. SPP-AMP-43 TaxID=3121288 RepID=UPI003C6E5C8A